MTGIRISENDRLSSRSRVPSLPWVEVLEDCKSYLDMAHYETRSWVGWHHHMTLVGLGHLFVTFAQKRLQRDVPELTLDRTVQLLEAALEEPELRLVRAIALVD